jgi:hypothetical protein
MEKYSTREDRSLTKRDGKSVGSRFPTGKESGRFIRP